MSRQLPPPRPRDAFKRALRAQLMAQAPSALGRRETAWSAVRWWSRSWLKPAAAFALKLAAEQLQLTLAFDDGARLRILSDAADHRLAELSRAVTARPGSAATATDEYAAAVARFTAAVDALRGKPDTSADKRTEAADVVDAAHAKHEAVLDDLEKSAPAAAQDGLDRAIQEADKLHPSDRPASGPDHGRTPPPARTPPTRP